MLDVLKTNNLNATLFITSDYINSPKMNDLMLRAYLDGHHLANHMPKDIPYHSYIYEAFETELIVTENILNTLVGTNDDNCKWFRPPHGRLSNAMTKCLTNYNYNIAMADVFSNDPHIINDVE